MCFILEVSYDLSVLAASKHCAGKNLTVSGLGRARGKGMCDW